MMADLQQTREQTVREAWGQCVSTFVDGQRVITRCAGTKLEAHHVVYRSHGGDDEPDNIWPICNRCHRDIHDGDRTGPFVDDDGRRFFRQDMGGKGEVRKVSIYDFRDLEDELHAEYVLAERYIAEGTYFGTKAWIRLCWAVWRTKELALWQLSGDDLESFEAWLRHIGMDPDSSTHRNYLWVAGKWYGEKNLTVDELDAALESSVEVFGRCPTPTELRSIVARTDELDGDEILDLVAGSPPMELAGVVDEEVERKRTERATREGKTRVLLRDVYTVTVERAMTSEGDSEADRRELHKRFCGAVTSYVPRGEGMVQWQRGGFTREILNPEVDDA